MANLQRMLNSTVFKKYIMAVTGLALVGFVVAHLAGNLQLLQPSGELFNKYAHHIENLGALVYLAELGLIIIVGLHIIVGVSLARVSSQARPSGYAVEQTKGGASKNTWASRNMLLLGAVLGVFIVVHIWHFKYGRGVAEGYVVDLQGVQARDLFRLVVEEFQKPGWVAFYTVVMIFLGLHVRHGFWSAFQSLGAMPGRASNGVYALALVLGALLAIGFVLLPLWIFIDPFNLYVVAP